MKASKHDEKQAKQVKKNTNFFSMDFIEDSGKKYGFVGIFYLTILFQSSSNTMFVCLFFFLFFFHSRISMMYL